MGHQLGQRLIEVELRPQAKTVHRPAAVLAQVHLVQIGLEDFTLAVVHLQQHRHEGFVDLARPGLAAVEKEILDQLLGQRAAALHHRAGLEVGNACPEYALGADPPMVVEAAVFHRHEAQGQQPRHVIELDQHTVFAMLRIDAADQHWIESRDGHRLAGARLGNGGHPIAGESYRQRRGLLRPVPEIEGARVDIDLLRIALDKAAHPFELRQRPITQPPQFIGKGVGAHVSAGIKLQRCRIDLRRQRPAGAGELAANLAIQPDQGGGEHQRTDAADHHQQGQQGPRDAAHQGRFGRFLASGATGWHPQSLRESARTSTRCGGDQRDFGLRTASAISSRLACRTSAPSTI